MSFIPVTDLANFSLLQGIVGQEEELLADVVPSNATNQTIEWSLVSGSAAFRVSGGQHYITPTSSAPLVVRATIRNGITQ